jgi:hypothetical protein
VLKNTLIICIYKFNLCIFEYAIKHTTKNIHTMANLTATQQEILNLQLNDWNVINRIKLSKIECNEEDLIFILKFIKKEIHCEIPKFVEIHKDGIHATVYNGIGKVLILNKKVAKDFAHLPITSNSKEVYLKLHADAFKKLSEKLARLKKLPVFQNGNLYAKTKAEINKIINN